MVITLRSSASQRLCVANPPGEPSGRDEAQPFRGGGLGLVSGFGVVGAFQVVKLEIRTADFRRHGSSQLAGPLLEILASFDLGKDSHLLNGDFVQLLQSL